MIFYPEERLAILIDGANIHSTAKSLGFEIDYKRMLKLFAAKARLIRALYYTALMENQEHDPLRPLIDWLGYNGFSVVTKPAKEYTDKDGHKCIKGNMDIELAIDMYELAPHVDHIVVASGDGDFRRAVEAVQSKGVRVSVISSLKTHPPFISDELRRQADNFIELTDLKPVIERQGNSSPTRGAS